VTWLCRLACLGCLVGCCFATDPVLIVAAATGALVFALWSEMARADVCACGHIARIHEHHRAGTDCGACGPRPAEVKKHDCPGSGCKVCGCPAFNPPWVRRAS